MPKCNKCKAKIQFVMVNNRWIPVEDYEIDSSERLSRRNRLPIPFDPMKHERHVCKKNEPTVYDNVYRG